MKKLLVILLLFIAKVSFGQSVNQDGLGHSFVYIGQFSTASRPVAAASNKGALILNSDSTGFNAFQVSDGTSWKSASSSGGLAVLGINKRGDTLSIVGSNIIALDPNPHNNGFYNMQVMKNTQREMAYVTDTTTVGGINDTTQIDFLLFGHSFFAQTQLMQQHMVQMLELKFPSCGPGFIPVNLTKFQGTNVTNTGWTISTPASVPFGRGLDLNEATSTVSGTDFQIGTTAIYQNLDYNKWTNLDIYVMDSTGYGSFVLTIDGVGQGTFSTNAAFGPARIQISGLANSYHSVDIHPTSTSNFVHLLGFKAYQRGVRGWMVSYYW